MPEAAHIRHNTAKGGSDFVRDDGRIRRAGDTYRDAKFSVFSRPLAQSHRFPLSVVQLGSCLSLDQLQCAEIRIGIATDDGLFHDLNALLAHCIPPVPPCWPKSLGPGSKESRAGGLAPDRDIELENPLVVIEPPARTVVHAASPLVSTVFN